MQPHSNKAGRTWVSQSNPKTIPWREVISHTAREEMRRNGTAQLTGAVAVFASFYLPRPKSLPAKYHAPVSKPDVDKLARALLDALTGVAWVDDSQVIHLSVSKHYRHPTRGTGVDIVIFASPGGKERT